MMDWTSWTSTLFFGCTRGEENGTVVQTRTFSMDEEKIERDSEATKPSCPANCKMQTPSSKAAHQSHVISLGEENVPVITAAPLEAVDAVMAAGYPAEPSATASLSQSALATESSTSAKEAKKPTRSASFRNRKEEEPKEAEKRRHSSGSRYRRSESAKSERSKARSSSRKAKSSAPVEEEDEYAAFLKRREATRREREKRREEASADEEEERARSGERMQSDDGSTLAPDSPMVSFEADELFSPKTRSRPDSPQVSGEFDVASAARQSFARRSASSASLRSASSLRSGISARSARSEPKKGMLSGMFGSSSTTFDSPSNAVILIDWDDTLCPTHWGNQGGKHGSEASKQLLKDHAMLVEEVLRTARLVARVAIVTLASPDWLQKSAARYFPGLDVLDLLKDLDIKVHYAVVPFCKSEVEFESARMSAKKKVMRKIISSFYPRLFSSSSTKMNVMSIGDSDVEGKALKQLMAENYRSSLCKILKFTSDPSLEQLVGQLDELAEYLPSLVQQNKSFEWSSGTLWRAS